MRPHQICSQTCMNILTIKGPGLLNSLFEAFKCSQKKMNTLIIFVNSSSSTWSMTHKRSKDRWVGVTWPFFISQCSIQQLCRAEQCCLCGHCQLASWLQRHHSTYSEQASSHFHSWEDHSLVGCCGRCQNTRHPPKSSTWVWWSTAVDVAISWRLAHPLQLSESTSEDIWWCWASSVSKGSWPSIWNSEISSSS